MMLSYVCELICLSASVSVILINDETGDEIKRYDCYYDIEDEYYNNWKVTFTSIDRNGYIVFYIEKDA